MNTNDNNNYLESYITFRKKSKKSRLRNANRGTKGQRSRSGSPRKGYFEGGQNKWRFPKYGFNSSKAKYKVINVGDINKNDKILDGQSLDFATDSKKGKIKILGNGDIQKKVFVKCNGFSKIAENKISLAGGRIEKV